MTEIVRHPFLRIYTLGHKYTISILEKVYRVEKKEGTIFREGEIQE